MQPEMAKETSSVRMFGLGCAHNSGETAGQVTASSNGRAPSTDFIEMRNDRH
jgi:hypothetical protein